MSVGWNELNKEEQTKIIEGWRDKGFGKPSMVTFTPTNEHIINEITKKSIQITAKEDEDNCSAVTSEDYDNWIYQALIDILSKRIQVGENSEKVEHPHDRLHRLGRESIAADKSSSFYEKLNSLLNSGNKLPTVPQRSMKTAQRRLTLANAYIEFLSGSPNAPRHHNLRTAKKEFKRQRQELMTQDLPDAIDDALKAHGLNWSAYDPLSPRKFSRKKR